MDTNHKCKRPSVACVDHKKQDLETLVLTPMINRMCLTCGKHWYGPEGQVKEYTRKEWDSWINSAAEVL